MSASITKLPKKVNNMHCSIIADIKERQPFHEHPPHELIICGSDKGQLEVNGKLIDYQVGRTLLIPSGVSHRIVASAEDVARTQFICFDDEFASSLGIFSLKNYLEDKFLNHSICSRFSQQRFRENNTLARRLQNEIDSPSLFGNVMARSILAQLLINHCRQAPISTLVKTNSKSFEIERCCEAILIDPSQRITLEKMAKEAGMSRSSFALRFKTNTGKSLIEYGNLIRLQKACQQLSSTDESATSIAYDCGFGNLGHFYSIFKKQYDMTPVDYRRWALEQSSREAAPEGNREVQSG